MPVLRLNLPQAESAIQSASPGVRITPTYGGNLGVSYWNVATPVHLVGSAGVCGFDLSLPGVPQGAAVLTGAGVGVADTLQVDSFGPMTEARAFAAVNRIAAGLQLHGWTASPRVVQQTEAQTHALLRGGSGVSVRDLRCGSAHLNLSLIQSASRPVSVTYRLVYDQGTK